MTAPPLRIISLAPTQTEIVAALGLLPNLAGVSENCNYPQEAACLPRFGSWHAPDLNGVIEARPDIVCTFGTHQEEVRDALAEAGVRCCHGDPPSVRAALECILEMAGLFGRSEAGGRLVSGLELRLGEVERRVGAARRRPGPSVLRIMNWDPFITVGPGAFQYDVIERAGGRNVMEDGPAPYFVCDPAMIRARDPEVIFFCEPHIRELLEKDPEWAKVSGVRHRRIYVFDCGLTCRSGPRIVDMVEQLHAVVADNTGRVVWDDGCHARRKAPAEQDPIRTSFPRRRESIFHSDAEVKQPGGEPVKLFFVYILSNKPRGTLYVGVTSDLIRRVWEHKNKCVPSFAGKYDVDRLVYYEVRETAEAAIHREKQIKKWRRLWKIRMIEENNPDWNDLYERIVH